MTYDVADGLSDGTPDDSFDDPLLGNKLAVAAGGADGEEEELVDVFLVGEEEGLVVGDMLGGTNGAMRRCGRFILALIPL